MPISLSEIQMPGENTLSETKTLASYLINSRIDDIPADIQHESRRSLLNYIGCAVGGSREPSVEIAAAAPCSRISESPPPAFWPGRSEWIPCMRRS